MYTCRAVAVAVLASHWLLTGFSLAFPDARTSNVQCMSHNHNHTPTHKHTPTHTHTHPHSPPHTRPTPKRTSHAVSVVHDCDELCGVPLNPG
eukprot:365207-Chlamydomonas_euryale.AAC.8